MAIQVKRIRQVLPAQRGFGCRELGDVQSWNVLKQPGRAVPGRQRGIEENGCQDDGQGSTSD